MYELSSFDSIEIGIASPEKIRSWSKGEVTKSETINYRTQKPERDGLFCEKIFGPVKDWECHCGKYKRVRYKGIICEKCGVEVTKSKVRRERMGHIELATPVTHIWYFKGSPSRISTILDVSARELEQVIYFAAYIVIDPGVVPELKKKQVINDYTYRKLLEKYKPTDFKAGMGAEAVKELLMEVDLEEESAKLKEQLAIATPNKKTKLAKRLNVVEAFRKTGNKPEWMVLDVIPVIPPDLRPMVQLDGGRFAASDLNDLYRRVINRNNRLKRQQELGAPELIIRNEKRMLQEAVDALIDNGRRGKAVTGAGGRELKSLTAMLKGKQGRFRQNLLGKRVDYSGRSVIVVGPELKLYQCGLPKEIALELFKPFIMRRLIEEGLSQNIKAAKRYIDSDNEKVWDILEEIIKDHPVLLNRAPTLHRLGIQAFEPVLVEGRAIKLHPLACGAFNADFDGDQMAVHLPLSIEAQAEARILMLCTNNILKLSDGKPIVSPTQDMVIGSYYLTIVKPGAMGEGRYFASFDEAMMAYQEKTLELQALCYIRVKTATGSRLVHSTLGRFIFNSNLPQDLRFVDRSNPANEGALEVEGILGIESSIDDRQFDILMQAQKSGSLKRSTANVCTKLRMKELTAEQAEKIDSAIKVGLKELAELDEKKAAQIAELENEKGSASSKDLDRINDSYENDKKLILGNIRKRIQINAFGQKQIAIGKKQLSQIVDHCFKYHGATDTTIVLDKIKALGYKYSTIGAVTTSVFDMHIPEEKKDIIQKAEFDVVNTERSYARGIISAEQRYNEIVRAWETASEKIEAELKKDLEDDFNPIWMMAKSGARGDMKQIRQLAGMRGLMKDPTGKTIELPVRASFREGLSVLEYFISSHGGRKGLSDTALKTADSGYLTRRLVDVAHSVIIQEEDCGDTRGKELGAIFEPKTQSERDPRQHIIEPMSDRINGRFAVEDIIDPYTKEAIVHKDELINEEQAKYIEEVLYKYADENNISIRDVKVRVRSVLSCRCKHGLCVKCYGKNMGSGNPVKLGEAVGIIAAQSIGEPGTQLTMRTFHTGGVATGDDITQGLPRVQELFEARKPKGQAIISEIDGFVSLSKKKNKETVTVTSTSASGENEVKEYQIPFGLKVRVTEGEEIKAGDPLTSGSINPHELLAVKSTTGVEEYIAREVQSAYRMAGVEINDKHIEVIVKQMLRMVLIEDQGDTDMLSGTYVDLQHYMETNSKAVNSGKNPAQGKRILLGVTKAALNAESFLSAASFQETAKVLTEAAINNKRDPLFGLKENVIIGKLIPAGTGMKRYATITTALPEGVNAAQNTEYIDRYASEEE